MTLALVTTRPTDAEFLILFNRLCVALREPADDSGVTCGIYCDALNDLPIAALEAGSAALMKETGRRFFPTTAEWRTAAEHAQAQQLRQAVPAAREQPWTHDCTMCEDTGWELAVGGRPMECSGDDRCGKQRKHDPHTYTLACGCRPTNRTFQRHQRVGGGA